MLHGRGAMLEFASIARMSNRMRLNEMMWHEDPVKWKEKKCGWAFIAVSLSSSCVCVCVCVWCHSSCSEKSWINSSKHRLLIPNMRSVNFMWLKCDKKLWGLFINYYFFPVAVVMELVDLWACNRTEVETLRERERHTLHLGVPTSSGVKSRGCEHM